MGIFGGDSYSASNVYNSVGLSNINFIDTSSLAEANKSGYLALNNTLKGFSDFTTAMNKSIADTLQVLAQNGNINNKQQASILQLLSQNGNINNKQQADILQVLAQNGDTDNMRRDIALKGIVVFTSGLFTYLVIKNKKGKI